MMARNEGTLVDTYMSHESHFCVIKCDVQNLVTRLQGPLLNAYLQPLVTRAEANRYKFSLSIPNKLCFFFVTLLSGS